MARELMTIRVDQTTRRRLASAARRRRRTESELARRALEAWLDHEEGAVGTTPYDAVADLIGRVHGGDRSRSTRGARGIAAALRKK